MRKKKLFKILSLIAINEAKKGANCTCWGPAYQPKMPISVKKLKTK